MLGKQKYLIPFFVLAISSAAVYAAPLKHHCGNAHSTIADNPRPHAENPYHYQIQYPNQVNQLMSLLIPHNLISNITTLSNFPSRYANSDDGVSATAWVRSQIEVFAEGRNDVTITEVTTSSSYKMNSLVVQIGNANAPAVVIGAHLDTVKAKVKPGADDDGSGSATVLELARVLLTSGMQFQKPIYLMWYAAEEEGLYGSKSVVKQFVDNKIPVYAVMQMDMTGWLKNSDRTIWLYDDYTDKTLNQFTEDLITTYVKQPVGHDKCGYACSDNASWDIQGFFATFPYESDKENPYMHTKDDTVGTLNLNHMTDFAKLAIAFTVEAAEPTHLSNS